LDCHSRVTGNAGLGHKFTVGEVKRYKRSWEQTIANRRGVKRPAIKYKKELISQIDVIVCEVLATKNIKRIRELLDVLFELHLYRGSSELDSTIVEGLHHLALMAGLNSAKLSTFVAEKLWEMCFHFVGPDRVPMRNKDRKYVTSCVRALRTLGDFSSGYIRKKEATDAFCTNIWNFLEIAVWYNWQQLAHQVVASLSDARKSCWHAGKLEYPIGDHAISFLAHRMLKYLRSEKPSWSKPIASLGSILRYGRMIKAKKLS
jgi:hypothetical protein